MKNVYTKNEFVQLLTAGFRKVPMDVNGLQTMELASTKSLSSGSLDFDLDFDGEDSRFLFKNRKFLPIERGQSTPSSSQSSSDSFSDESEV